MVVASLVIGGIALLILLPKLLEILDFRTASEKRLDAQEEKKRQEKGAIGNTVDFLFGEGTVASLGTRASTPEELSAKFSKTFGSKVTFDKSTRVDPKTGIITADKPPTFNLSEQEKLIIRNSRQKLKGRRTR